MDKPLLHKLSRSLFYTNWTIRKATSGVFKNSNVALVAPSREVWWLENSPFYTLPLPATVFSKTAYSNDPEATYVVGKRETLSLSSQ